MELECLKCKHYKNNYCLKKKIPIENGYAMKSHSRQCQTIKIDIGCGTKLKKGFIGLDKEKYTKDIKYKIDLNKQKLPFKNNTISEINCEHVLEHLEYPEKTISEIYRVLKKRAIAYIVVPYFSFYTTNMPFHKTNWSSAAIKIFDGKKYHETHYKFECVKFTFFRDARWYGKPIKYLFEWLANNHTNFYERFFCYLYPMQEIRIEARK